MGTCCRRRCERCARGRLSRAAAQKDSWTSKSFFSLFPEQRCGVSDTPRTRERSKAPPKWVPEWGDEIPRARLQDWPFPCPSTAPAPHWFFHLLVSLVSQHPQGPRCFVVTLVGVTDSPRRAQRCPNVAEALPASAWGGSSLLWQSHPWGKAVPSFAGPSGGAESRLLPLAPSSVAYSAV